MTLSVWLTVVSICVLGAMFPGPSLALVLQHTLRGGRRQGMICGIAHGAGIGLYALLTVAGLAAVLAAAPWLFTLLQWGGALYLGWLGLKGLRARAVATVTTASANVRHGAARDGFLMAFLNPKAALFFLALFSQVVGPDTAAAARIGYALTAMLIDMGWYLLVAWLFSQPRWLAALQRHSLWVERAFGLLLLGLAVSLALR